MNAQSRRDRQDLCSFGVVRRAGRLVTKQDLLEDVWPGIFVDEGFVSVHVASLRKALGEGWGYRFIGSVVQTARGEAETGEHSAWLDREARR